MSLDLGPLLHTLGLDADHRTPWRDHYVTGGEDAQIAALVEAGLMEAARRPGFLPAEDRVFRATTEGRRAAIAENNRRHPPPGRAKARYLAWLRADGVFGTFGEYLRRRGYDQRGAGS